jgi:hypothetical protein
MGQLPWGISCDGWSEVETIWPCLREKPLGAVLTSLTELPFAFPSRVLRSPMPFGPYDLQGEFYNRFCEEQIAV